MQTILIIDDDAAIGDLEQEVLEREGYGVLRAYSGTEALLLLKSSHPDLILLDLMLPGLSGQEVLPQLLGIPVIVVSARAAVQEMSTRAERMTARTFFMMPRSSLLVMKKAANGMRHCRFDPHDMETCE